MYKLIATDMDGTLLKKDKTISEATKKAICNAREAGTKFVLATGRPIQGIKKYLQELNLVNDYEDNYALTFNGALVVNTRTNEVIYSKSLSISDLDILYPLAKSFDIDMHLFTEDGLFTEKMNKYTEIEATINNIEAQICNFSTLDVNSPMIKFMMVGEKEALDAIEPKLSKEVHDKFTIVRSSNIFLEFLHKECNKGVGVKALSEYLEIKQDEIICLGDAGNDYHMIDFAGLGIAMDNAFPEIKEIANYITDSNENDGVAKVIEKFILSKEIEK